MIRLRTGLRGPGTGHKTVGLARSRRTSQSGVISYVCGVPCAWGDVLTVGGVERLEEERAGQTASQA